MDIKDKIIVITGGGQGLGATMAITMAAKGAKLALIDLDQEKLDKTVQLCKEAGGDGKAYIANVAKEEDVESVFSQIVSDFGAVHVLINNAGIIRDGLMIKAKDGVIVDRMSFAQWQSVIDVNLTGVFLCGREAATKMIETGTKGVIINISSISKAGNMGQSNYSAAKAGVAAMATTWAKELARHGIRAAAIAPGFIATEMVASMKEEALDKMKAGIPLRRLGQPEEIANTAQFIVENDYFTGRVIELDGGLRL
ncbi:MAG: SDR family oxidoreductase [Pseudomonadales bacterium]